MCEPQSRFRSRMGSLWLWSLIWSMQMVQMCLFAWSTPAGIIRLPRSEDEGRVEQWVELISEEPRAMIYHNFLSKEECEYLIGLAKPYMRKPTIINSLTGEVKIDTMMRTCWLTSLARGQDKVIRNIEERIANFTFIPVEYGEGFEVRHYEIGQMFVPHHDSFRFRDVYNTRNGGQRMATVLMYLSDVEEGGETIFPNAKGNFSALPRWNNLPDCGKYGLSVKPKMGDALLFWNIKPDAALDESSQHGSCPVIKGSKWTYVKWMCEREYKV